MGNINIVIPNNLCLSHHSFKSPSLKVIILFKVKFLQTCQEPDFKVIVLHAHAMQPDHTLNSRRTFATVMDTELNDAPITATTLSVLAKTSPHLHSAHQNRLAQ